MRLYLIISLFLSTISAQRGGADLPHLVDSSNAFLIKQYIDAITAYGPGLGVYAPYSYVDVSYDNIPGVGKIPVLGKEGTSSRLGISPFYPPQGNPSNPFPPLYRARPLPPHIPEPVDVVAVPLDEEALHGEPLFPKELTLPSEQLAASEAALLNKEGGDDVPKKPEDPFAGAGEPTMEEDEHDLINWDAQSNAKGENSAETNQVKASADDLFFVDKAKERSTTMEKMEVAREKETPLELQPKSPFARVVRTKRVKRLAEILKIVV